MTHEVKYFLLASGTSCVVLGLVLCFCAAVPTLLPFAFPGGDYRIKAKELVRIIYESYLASVRKDFPNALRLIPLENQSQAIRWSHATYLIRWFTPLVATLVAWGAAQFITHSFQFELENWIWACGGLFVLAVSAMLINYWPTYLYKNYYDENRIDTGIFLWAVIFGGLGTTFGSLGAGALFYASI